MLGVTAEQIAEWDAELSVLTRSLGFLFNRPEPRVVFAQFIEGLLAELPKKNGWTLSERAGHVTADRMQWLLNGSVWDADRLRDAVRDYVITHLGNADASLVIDDTQAQKKGTRSVGVAFQHCGLTGDVRNCQTMVMLTYATTAGHALIDRRLYLPEEWTADRERCRKAGVPHEVAFATKPELAIAMLEQARAARVPFTWILADAGYGRDPQLRAWCHQRAVPYVLGVPVDLPLDGPPGKPRQPAVKRADDLLRYAKVRDQWERRSCGTGSKGERLYDWTAFAVEVKDEEPAETFTHWLVLRRSLHPNRRGKDGQLHREIAYFLAHAPQAATVSEIIARAGGRWQIEEDNELNKQLVGLAQYQVRKWTPWHRHVSACMLATAFLAVQRAAIPEPGPQEPKPGPEHAPTPGKDQITKESEAAG
ncbi:IS701 family transposase [Streptomyces mirabilis]|uniref:IS701 family transposase n=1 Tax=Streptomyces mirabilis TaxID=68239 RepID=A0ABU3V5Z4_9ACTN|nr:IS701 family transposase [Streptomyces mirabilis]MDU9001601.1 IS701 family transposase [Streptomyces mirabilis]